MSTLVIPAASCSAFCNSIPSELAIVRATSWRFACGSNSACLASARRPHFTHRQPQGAVDHGKRTISP